VIRPDILGSDRAGADHPVLADVHSGKNGCVIGDANVVVYPRHSVGDIALVDDAVRVTVDVREIADGDAIAQHDSAAIVQQHVPMNDDVVADFEVVPERNFDVLKRLEILATLPEDALRQNPAEPDTEIDVLPA